MLLGGLGSAFAFALLFNPPESLSPTVAVVIGLLAYATFYTIFNVPYMAMPAEMSTDPAERTKLVSWRVKAIGVGQLIGAAPAVLMILSCIPLLLYPLKESELRQEPDHATQ